MSLKKLARSAALYGLLILLATASYYCGSFCTSEPVSALFYCLHYCIHVGLIMTWGISAHRRLLPSHARRYLIGSAALMLLFLLIRAFRYRSSECIALLPEYGWYSYYIPLLLIPTLFAAACINMHRSQERRTAKEAFLLLPAASLVAAVLTNRFHHLAFRPLQKMARFIGMPSTYRYGPVYYLALAWIVAMLLLGALELLLAARRKSGWRRAAAPAAVMLVWALLASPVANLGNQRIPKAFGVPLLSIYGLLGTFEACFFSGLLPANRGYPRTFSALTLPAVITDRKLRPAYATAVPIKGSPAQFEQALRAPVYLDADTCLIGHPLMEGAVFWTRDEAELNRLDSALQAANESLRKELRLLQTLLRRQAAEQSDVDARKRLYARVEAAVLPARRRIAALLAETEPDTPEFRAKISRVLVMTVFVKRMSNFAMLEAEDGQLDANELGAALRESAHYLSYCGLHMTFDLRADRLSARDLMAAYDCFELLAEALIGKTEELWVRVTEDRLLLMADCTPPDLMPRTPLPVRVCAEDGQLVLTAAFGGDAA